MNDFLVSKEDFKEIFRYVSIQDLGLFRIFDVKITPSEALMPGQLIKLP